MATDRSVLDERWGDFANLSEMEQASLRNGRFLVEVNKGKFECLFFNKTSPNRLFVLLSGARDPKKQVLPKFDRWSWHEKLPGSVLCVSDPTLFLDVEHLRIGWYLGDEVHDWSRSLADLVTACAQMLDISTRKIITYGSSAGGFGSLKLAGLLGDATAVAINPQTNALKYFQPAVDRLLNVGYGGVSSSDLSPELRQRFSAIDPLKASPEARCLVVQNKLDLHHYSQHFKSFCDEFSIPHHGGEARDGRIIARVYESPDGHGPEPKDMVDEIINLAVNLSDLSVSADLVNSADKAE